jgi:putative transposase
VTKRRVIQSLSSMYPTRMLCDMLDIGPSTYYYERQGRDDLSLLALIEGVLLRFPTYGYRRVTEQLHREGCSANHKRVIRVMGANDLLAVVRHGIRTTQSKHRYGRYPNLVKGLAVVRPDEVWCADITYIRLQWQFVYLAIILDVFTRGLRGWHLGRTLSSDLALTALERALTQRKPGIHHSDQGVQYAALGYVERLQSVGAQVSMAAAGRPGENPYAERVIRTIKEEEVYLNEYENFADAYRRIGHFIEDVYQTKRIHSSLGYLTPAEFEMLHLTGSYA